MRTSLVAGQNIFRDDEVERRGWCGVSMIIPVFSIMCGASPKVFARSFFHSLKNPNRIVE
jgi:hypothetical protein